MILTTLQDNAGLEALSISEKIKIFFSEMSLGVDKLNSQIFNDSIHTVDGVGVFKLLKSQNDYFTFSSNQIPTPVFFNPDVGDFRSYVAFCLSGIGLLRVADAEVERLYINFKRIVLNGEVPFSIRNWDHGKEIDDVKQKMNEWFIDSKVTTRQISQLYTSVTNAEEIYKYYNDTVKTLKSRDVEILNKKIDNLIEIFKLIKRKIDAKDISFTVDDTITMECCIGRLAEIVSTSGLIMSRLNELCRVLELQVPEFKRYIKK